MHPSRVAIAIAVGMLSAGCDGCKHEESAQIPPPLADGGEAATGLATAAPTGVAVLPIPSASVIAALNPGGLPPYSGPTGSVEGDVRVTGDPAPATMGKSFVPCPEAAAVYGKQFRDGPARPDGSRALADAIVAVRMTGGGIFVPEKNEAQLVTIDKCAYSARTVVLTFGQRLEVKNLADPASKKLYAPTFENQGAPALMIAPPGGDAVKLYPKQMGRYRLVDKIKNDWLEADVFVIGHPLHGVSDVAGHYRVDGIPVGKRTVNASHPAIPGGGVDSEVEIRANVVTRLDVTLPYTKAAPPPQKDAGAQAVLP